MHLISNSKIFSCVLIGFMIISLFGFIQDTDADTPLKSKFSSVEYGEISSSSSWNVLPDKELDVVILDNNLLTEEQLGAVFYAIKSNDSIELDNVLNKNSENSKSTYYYGWEGALSNNVDTVNIIPTKFNLVSSINNESDILIQFSNNKNPEGYSGYTILITHNDEILQSHILIYEVESLSVSDLTTIVRNEFGHALGLGHSIDSKDLMSNIILTETPYISECDVDIIRNLYDNKNNDFVECK